MLEEDDLDDLANDDMLRALEQDAVIADSERENELAAQIAAEYPAKYGENAPVESMTQKQIGYLPSQEYQVSEFEKKN